MHIADVNKGMLGANDIGTLAVPMGQIAAASTGYGSVTIAGQRPAHWHDHRDLAGAGPAGAGRAL